MTRSSDLSQVPGGIRAEVRRRNPAAAARRPEEGAAAAAAREEEQVAARARLRTTMGGSCPGIGKSSVIGNRSRAARMETYYASSSSRSRVRSLPGRHGPDAHVPGGTVQLRPVEPTVHQGRQDDGPGTGGFPEQVKAHGAARRPLGGAVAGPGDRAEDAGSLRAPARSIENPAAAGPIEPPGPPPQAPPPSSVEQAAIIDHAGRTRCRTASGFRTSFARRSSAGSPPPRLEPGAAAGRTANRPINCWTR